MPPAPNTHTRSVGPLQFVVLEPADGGAVEVWLAAAAADLYRSELLQLVSMVAQLPAFLLRGVVPRAAELTLDGPERTLGPAAFALRTDTAGNACVVVRCQLTPEQRARLLDSSPVGGR